MKLLSCLTVLFVFLMGCGNPDASRPAGKKNDMALKFYNHGIEDLKDHDIKKAAEEFHLAIAQNPKDVKAYLMLGDLYLHGKLYDRAIKYFTVAGKLKQDDGKIFLMLARCYELAGEKENAINALKKSALIFKANNDMNNYKASLVTLKTLMDSEQSDNDIVKK